MKEQSTHGLNDNEMLVEIMRNLTKIEGNINMTSEQVLAWARRFEAQRGQSAIINSLGETKNLTR